MAQPELRHTDDILPDPPNGTAPVLTVAPRQDRKVGLVILVGMVAAYIIGGILISEVWVAVPLFLAIIMPMVLFHEWGHYWTAKKFGIASREFFIGFGPRIWSFHKGETEFGVKAFIPLGGYVKIVGMSQYEDVEPRFAGRTFRDAKPWQRFIVLVAGSCTHFITALVLWFVLLVAIGQPAPSPSIGQVETDSPAAAAGLVAGDRIVAVDGQSVAGWEQTVTQLKSRPGQTVTLTVQNAAGQQHQTTATLRSVPAPDGSGTQVGQLGIVPGTVYETVPVLQAVPATFGHFWTVLSINGAALGKVFAPSNLSCLYHQMTDGSCSTLARFNSPVGVAHVATQVADRGIYELLALIVTINIFVGAFNLLPLLPLDGGHIAVLGIEKVASVVMRRPVEIDQRHLVPITVAVMSLLMLIAVSALYLDIVDPVNLPR